MLKGICFTMTTQDVDCLFVSICLFVFSLAGKCPFNQVPILEIKEDASSEPIVLSQSVAIFRYLANEFGE